jgi:hypothetical protein
LGPWAPNLGPQGLNINSDKRRTGWREESQEFVFFGKKDKLISTTIINVNASKYNTSKVKRLLCSSKIIYLIRYTTGMYLILFLQ